MVERRMDPRTDRSYSLENLLRTRAERARWDLAVLGTSDGHVLAASGPEASRFATKAAAHVSRSLFARGGKGTQRFAFAPPSRPDVKLSGLTFDVRGQPVFVAVLVDGAPVDDRQLGEIRAAIERILNETPR